MLIAVLMKDGEHRHEEDGEEDAMCFCWPFWILLGLHDDTVYNIYIYIDEIKICCYLNS